MDYNFSLQAQKDKKTVSKNNLQKLETTKPGKLEAYNNNTTRKDIIIIIQIIINRAQL